LSQLSLNSAKDSFTPTYFVDAILPLPIPRLFTYRVPREMESGVAVGSRIVVPFGKSKILTAVIHQVHNAPPKDYEAKYIIDLLEETPSINAVQLQFFQWLADYYMCTLGEVMQAALPSGLKINTTSLVQRNPYFNEEDFVLSIEEQLLMQQLSVDVPVESIKLADLVGQKKISKVLKALIDKEAILLIDHIKEKFTPKIKKYVRLDQGLVEDEKALENVFSRLEKKQKQLDVLMAYLRSVPALENDKENTKGMPYDELMAQGCSPSSVKTMVKHGIFEIFNKEISRFAEKKISVEPKKLSAAQEKAKQSIIDSYKSKNTVLLHGITGSGKTEIYIELIRDTIAGGHQVLYLLPEIALTSQIVSRLEGIFGPQMGVYHSKFSANERVEVWKKLLANELNLVIGVRSSIFLPFDDLGLIIIDEEHESSFKQYDPAPRYNARDAALMLANIHQAKSLLGSATPSLESYFLAEKGKYGHVSLLKRYGAALLPTLKTVDIARAYKTKEMQGNFSEELIDEIKTALATTEQVIIFQNRRGYAPFLSCATCSWVPKCERCDVSLTYHQYKNELRCHYCGYKIATPTTCQACGSTHIKTVSFGTEQLEEELSLLFPETEIGRLDLDTTRGRDSYDRIIKNFGSGKTNILVGTQMVAKGLDFDNVGLVGIIDLDRMLHFPDFRSVEKSFQLSVQVAGRAGRREKPGKVLIQTYNPNQAIVQTILTQDYKAFFTTEIEERRLFNYPPFTRIIKLTVKDKSHQTAAEAVSQLYQLLVCALGQPMILGPIIPSVAKIRNKYLRELYLKVGRSKNISRIKETILASKIQIITQKEFKSTVIAIDVDPL
jgi:primosomal protein N' (replication factor Y) (superfamily II helicase)